MFPRESSLVKTMILMVAVTAVAGVSSGIEGDKGEKVWKIQEQRQGTGGHAVVEVLAPDGKKRKIEALHSPFHADQGPSIVSNVVGVAHAVGDYSDSDQSALWKSMEKDLEQAGLDSKQLKKVREALETAWEVLADKSKEHTIIRGKIKMIGPDGKVEEIDLDEKNTEWDEIEGLNAKNLIVAQAGKSQPYMIGVECADADEPLRSQLQLDEGVGLVVKSVLDDMPAKKAGVHKNDVLVRANDRELSEIQDLIEVVQAAGEHDEEVSLTLIHNGEKRTISVKPEKRKSIGLNISEWVSPNIWTSDPHESYEYKYFTLDSVTPRLFWKQPELQELRTQIEEIGRKLDQLQEEITDLKKRQ